MRANSTTFSIAVCDEILSRLRAGESMKGIARDEHMPERWTVWRWRRDTQNKMPDGRTFATHFEEAELERADNLVEDAVERARTISDELTGDRQDTARVAAARLEIDTARWLASKVLPKKYGDKMALTDKDGGNLVVNVVHYMAEQAKSNGQTVIEQSEAEFEVLEQSEETAQKD